MAAPVDERGRIRDRFERDLESHEPRYVINEVVAAVTDALASIRDGTVRGVGVGAPGNIDVENGTVKYSPNFQWRNVPLVALLRKRIAVPVHLLNDARCATLGEYMHGVGRGTTDFALITLGTGIGGGIVGSGRLLLGNSMGAGEVGHHVIRPNDGFQCTCGKIGCFEAQASGTGLLRHALAVAASFPRSTLLSGRKQAKWSAKMVRKAATAGDPHAQAAWRRWLADLALGVSNIIAFVNPQTIALGGGAGQAAEKVLAKPLSRLVDELTTMVPKGTTRIVSAALGNDAGAVGAAALVFAGGVRGLTSGDLVKK